jgi:protein TonB
MIVRCVIEVDGHLENCKVIKSLPYMEEAVLSALATHKYTPVMFQGKPQRVNYTFNIKLKASP